MKIKLELELDTEVEKDEQLIQKLIEMVEEINYTLQGEEDDR